MITKEDMKAYQNYSERVERKIITDNKDRLMENTLGLMGEAGEVAEKIKKRIRDDTKVKPEEIVKELGDVIFYATALSNFYGASLGITIAENMMKLDGRESRGTIKGSGDER